MFLIDIHYDNDQYFEGGFASEVSVVLIREPIVWSWPAKCRKVLVSLRSQRFDVSVGTIEVPLNIENLPNGMTAVATPQRLQCWEEVQEMGWLLCHKLTSKPDFDPKLQIDSVTVSNERVSVTTDQETLAQIDKVIALLPTMNDYGNYSGSVPCRLLIATGVVLPVVITRLIRQWR